MNAIDRRCSTARGRVITLLAAPCYGYKLLGVLEALHAPPTADATGVALPGFAATRLERWVRKLNRLSAGATIDDPTSLHALRSAVKRLRHALDLLSSLHAAPGALRQLVAVQERLGRLLDLSTADLLLPACADAEPPLREAVALVRAWHGPRRADLVAAISRDLPRLARLQLPESAAAAAEKL
jgi:adenylate cyclase